MKKFYYIVATLLGIFLLSWLLPWLLTLCFPTPAHEPFVGYSPVNDRFIVSLPVEQNSRGDIEFEICDIDPATGLPDNRYDTEQRDSLLPEIFANQLQSKGIMPDSIKGIEMSIPNIRRNRWMFTSMPRNINRDIPEIYPLMESMPKRFDLENPTVALYMPGQVEIIDMESNSIDSVKTRRFAKMFADRGFKFPAKEAYANVTVRKAYDNGYLLIDANNDLYHLKMQANRPSMARIGHPADVTPQHVFVMENGDRAHYGLVTTEENRTFVIARDDNYSLIELPGVSFNPEKQRMSILKGLFVWTIKISDENRAEWIAISTDDYSYITSYTYHYPANRTQKIAAWIFPFTTRFTESTDLFVYPRIGNFSYHALYLNVLLAAILWVIARKRRQRHILPMVAATLITGIFAFITLIIIKH